MATVTPPPTKADPKKVPPAAPAKGAAPTKPAAAGAKPGPVIKPGAAKPAVTTSGAKPAAPAAKPAAAPAKSTTTVTPAAKPAEASKTVVPAAKPAPAKQAAPAELPPQTAVKGTGEKVEGVVYFEGQGNPPCYGKSFDPAHKECGSECILRVPCPAAKEASTKPTLVSAFVHPKKDLIKRDGEEGYEAGFVTIKGILDTARADVERVLRRPTLQIAEIAGKLHNSLTKETCEKASEKYLGFGYRQFMNFVKVQEKFGHLPKEEAQQLVDNCGSQENLFGICKAEDPISLARKGEVTFKDVTSGKTVTKKLAELTKREVPVALKAAPGIKPANPPRKPSKNVAPTESKAKPMPIVRRIGKAVGENLATLKEVTRKTKTGEVTGEDLRELKPLPQQLRDAATQVEALIAKAAKAPSTPAKSAAKPAPKAPAKSGKKTDDAVIDD